MKGSGAFCASSLVVVGGGGGAVLSPRSLYRGRYNPLHYIFDTTLYTIFSRQSQLWTRWILNLLGPEPAGGWRIGLGAGGGGSMWNRRRGIERVGVVEHL